MTSPMTDPTHDTTGPMTDPTHDTTDPTGAITVRYFAGARAATGVDQERVAVGRSWALEDLADVGEITADEATLARIAGWLHDAAYDPAAPPGPAVCYANLSTNARRVNCAVEVVEVYQGESRS